MTPAALPPWLSRALRHPVASAAAMTLGIRVAQDLSRYQRGEIDREELEKRAGQHLGSLGGTVAGAALGWSLGRAFPGLGSIIGAFSGGLMGHLGGERVGRAGAERMSKVLVREDEAAAPEPGEPSEGAEPVATETETETEEPAPGPD